MDGIIRTVRPDAAGDFHGSLSSTEEDKAPKIMGGDMVRKASRMIASKLESNRSSHGNETEQLSARYEKSNHGNMNFGRSVVPNFDIVGQQVYSDFLDEVEEELPDSDEENSLTNHIRLNATKLRQSTATAGTAEGLRMSAASSFGDLSAHSHNSVDRLDDENTTIAQLYSKMNLMANEDILSADEAVLRRNSSSELTDFNHIRLKPGQYSDPPALSPSPFSNGGSSASCRQSSPNETPGLPSPTPRFLKNLGFGATQNSHSAEHTEKRGGYNMRSSGGEEGDVRNASTGSTPLRRWFGGVPSAGAAYNPGEGGERIPHLRSSLRSSLRDVSLHSLQASSEQNAHTQFNSSFGHHAKSRSQFMKRNLNSATNDTQSFRNLQKIIKEKGVTTAQGIQMVLQEAAQEHAVDTHATSGVQYKLNSLDSFSSLGEAEEKYHSNIIRPNGSSMDLDNLWGKRQHQPLNESDSDVQSRNGAGEGLVASAVRAPMRYIQRRASNSSIRIIKENPLQDDSIFGCRTRTYSAIPSHERDIRKVVEAMYSAANQGESSLICVCGERYVGKSMLIAKSIETVNKQGPNFTVLRSRRNIDDVYTSYYPLREIVRKALRLCDEFTQRSDESSTTQNTADSTVEHVTDDMVLGRLISRKTLNKSDRLMLGRVLPDCCSIQLLSLLKGRNPTALAKDLVATLLKVFIPLQPVMLVFESDGKDGSFDQSSWELIEELLLSAIKHCPQLVLLTESREKLQVPDSIASHSQSVEIGRMDKYDTESYIKAIFCEGQNEVDRHMSVDYTVLDGVFTRAQGCPLFTERIVSWARRRDLIELDETRNAVSLYLPSDDEGEESAGRNNNEKDELVKALPANLYEEILSVMNRSLQLSDCQLDAIKLASCLGYQFDLNNDYAQLRDTNELHTTLQQVGIFDIIEESKYKWRHIAIYEAVESIIISNERVELQLRITDSLAHVPNAELGQSLYASHFMKAQRVDEAFDLYMEAGKRLEENLDFTAAVGMYVEAKACLSKSSKKPSLRRKLSPYAALGWCLRELVRYEEAEKELEFCLTQTMAVPERKRNSLFKEVELDIVATLAQLKQAQSKYSEALELYDDALPTARANRKNHSHVWLAQHIASAAEIHRKSGSLEVAKRLHTEALSFRELAVEESSCTILELALSFTQLGCVHASLGDYSGSFNLHKKALIVRSEYLDFNHGLVSESLNYCADALSALGRPDEGIPLGMHAVSIRKFVFGPLHPAYAHALSVLASCYHGVGRSFDSLSLLTECLEICERAFSKNHANMIPNLLLYGSVLSYSGKTETALDVYRRAKAIHESNFNNGQNENQLLKISNAIDELSKSVSESRVKVEMPIPPMETDNGVANVIVCADFGQRAADEFMIAVASSLQAMGSLNLVSVVAAGPPEVVRANIARGALDSLLLPRVPVAYSTTAPTESKTSPATSKTFGADYARPSAHINTTGVDLITRALLQAPNKSIVFLCSSSPGDLSKVMENDPNLFSQKVKQIVFLCSVKPPKKKCFIEPDEGGGKADSFTENVYRRAQELQIETVTIAKDSVRGFPFPSGSVDELAATNHMVSNKVQHCEKMQMNGIWELIKLARQETKGGFGFTRNVDQMAIKDFSRYYLGGKPPPAGQHGVWPSIKSINLELVFGLLCCIPMYQDSHFRWELHHIHNVRHKICRQNCAANGILNCEALSNEISVLIGFAFRSSLLKTSC